MDTSKFSNFTIEYILGERTGPQSPPAENGNSSSSASQTFEEHFSKVSLNPGGVYMPQASGGATMGFQTPCPGIFDTAHFYNSVQCCGPVTYYQTNFSMSYFGGEQWFHTHPECDREDNHCYQNGQMKQRNRIRTVFTENQIRQLDQLFSITDYPSTEARAQLARRTGLSEETVRVWFKNRRARRKRQRPTGDSTEA